MASPFFVCHSKKDVSLRRTELLEAVSRPLVQYIVKHCEELVLSNPALLLLLSVITHVKSKFIQFYTLVRVEPLVSGLSEYFKLPVLFYSQICVFPLVNSNISLPFCGLSIIHT